MVGNTGARPIQSLRNLYLIRREFFEMVFFCHKSEFHQETYQSPRWKDGYMHGYGIYLYFSVGADKVPKCLPKVCGLVSSD